MMMIQSETRDLTGFSVQLCRPIDGITTRAGSMLQSPSKPGKDEGGCDPEENDPP